MPKVGWCGRALLVLALAGCGGKGAAEDGGGGNAAGGAGGASGNSGAGRGGDAGNNAGRGGGDAGSDGGGGDAGTTGGTGGGGDAGTMGGTGGRGGATAGSGGNGSGGGAGSGGSGSGGGAGATGAAGNAGTGGRGGGAGDTGAAGSGGTGGQSGVSYSTCNSIGGINRIIVAKRDTARNLCVVFVMSSPATNPFNLTLPPNYGMEEAFAMPIVPDCRTRLRSGGSVDANGGTGSVALPPTTTPTIQIDVTLTFPPGDAGAGASERLMANTLLPPIGCP